METAQQIQKIQREALSPEQLIQARGSINLGPYIAFKRRNACAEKAQSVPLPGASADAFLRGATKVGDVIVREVVPVHIACLQSVDSPILKMVSQATESKEKKSNSDFGIKDQWYICHIFTTDTDELLDILDCGGADKIKEVSKAAINKKWNAAKINMVMLAVIEQFHRHIQTTVKFAAEVEGQVDKSFFQALTQMPSVKAE